MSEGIKTAVGCLGAACFVVLSLGAFAVINLAVQNSSNWFLQLWWRLASGGSGS